MRFVVLAVLLSLVVPQLCAATEGVTDTTDVDGMRYIRKDDTWFLAGGGGLGTEVLSDVVSVRFSSDVTPAQRDSVFERLGVTIRRVSGLGTYDLALSGGMDPVETLEELSATGLAEFVSPSVPIVFASAPDDEYYGLDVWVRQWNLHDDQIDAENAWAIVTGDSGVIVAVIDTGIEPAYEELEGAIWRNWADPVDSTDNDGNGYVDDYRGWNFWDTSNDIDDNGDHGSAVSGIIAAQTNNDGTGIAGIAGGWFDTGWTAGLRDSSACFVMPLAIAGSSTEVEDAIVYAAKNGAHVINMSFTLSDTVLPDVAAAIDAAADSGLVMVAASGNGDPDEASVKFPASDPDVIAVGAVLDTAWLTSYTLYGDSLEIVAPSGPCVLRHNCASDSARMLWTTHDDTRTQAQDEFTFFSGTSGASPQVAAVAALIKSVNPSRTRDEIRKAIRASAQDELGDPNDTRGRDQYYGYGRVDAYQAVFVGRGGGTTSRNLLFSYDVEFDRDVKVSSGDTLTILPGVTVEFAAGYDGANIGVDSTRCELIVEGTLYAHGAHGPTADTLVTFTASAESAGAWYGIRAPSDTGSIDLRYCAIENAYKGVAVDNPDALELAQLDIDDCAAHGIYLEDCGSSAKVDTCTLTDPGLVGIEARDCTGVTLEGHRITDASDYGVKCYDVASMTVIDNYVLGDSSSVDFVGIRVKPAADTSHYSIEGNTVERCSSRGIWCSKGIGDDATVERNCVSDSTYTRGGTGVYFYQSAAKMRETSVEVKTHGVVAFCGTASGTSWKPDLGDSTGLGEDGDNRFIDNSSYYISTVNLGQSTLMAERNWYGSSSPDMRKFSGSIDYVPYLTSDPGSSPKISPGEVGTRRLTLDQNHPNPFNPVTDISFNVPRSGHVTLKIYNVAGRAVRNLVDERRDAGEHRVVWDGRDDQGNVVATGVYFARLKDASEVEIRKLVLLK